MTDTTQNMQIERYGKDAVVSSPAAVFSYQVTDLDVVRENSSAYAEKEFLWSSSQLAFDDYQIIPYGNKNNIPQLLRDVVYSNPNIPGVFEKKQGLLWGQGPALYRETFKDGKNGNKIKVREWQENKQITAWLENWDYLDYLLAVITDFNFIQGSPSKFIREKGSLIGRNKFHSLEHIDPMDFRLATKINSSKATHGIVSEYFNNSMLMDYKVYPLFDAKNPFAAPNQIMFSVNKTFATKYYAIPTIYGSLEWIRRSTAIPLILRALSKNSINAKYHITSPAKFWDDKKKELTDKAEAEGRDYDDRELQIYETELFSKLTKTLSDDQNVGKILHTKNLIFSDGMSLKEQGWTITPIDQNIKDFVDTQIKISNKADSAVSAALGIHKSLAGISGEGKADSGSEQLYAYLMYKLIGVDIPEYIVCKALNAAIKANFPETDLKIGFYHEEAQKQEDQTSGDRVKNTA